jgi:hypothetical protein
MVGRRTGLGRLNWVPAYAAVDMRYAWLPRRGLELSLIGQKLSVGATPSSATPGPSAASSPAPSSCTPEGLPEFPVAGALTAPIVFRQRNLNHDGQARYCG